MLRPSPFPLFLFLRHTSLLAQSLELVSCIYMSMYINIMQSPLVFLLNGAQVRVQELQCCLYAYHPSSPAVL